MLSPLTSGTNLNPTLSVAAPPGLRFYSDVKSVPIVYGNALVEGTTIDDISKLMTSYNENGDASLWQAICFGEIALKNILFDSDINFLPAGTSWLASNFNNGNPVVFNDYTPTIYQRSASGTERVVQPYLSPLHGMAHYYFDSLHPLPWTDANKKTIKKIRYDVERKLATGISVHGDNIPWTKSVISGFLSTVVTFIDTEGRTGEDYLDRQMAVMLLPSNLSFLNLPAGTPFIFLEPPSPLRLIKYKQADPDDPTTTQFLANTTYYIHSTHQDVGSGIKTLFISDVAPGPDVAELHLGEPVDGLFDDPRTVACSVTMSLAQVRIAGNNPASVIFDLLTNKQYGLGLDSAIDINTSTGAVDPNKAANSQINVSSFWNVLEYFYNHTQKPYGVNCSFQQQAQARDMIKKVCEWTDCILTKDRDGKFYLTVNDPGRLYTFGRMGGVSLPGNVPKDSLGIPTLTKYDFPEFEPTEKTINDTVNEFRAKFCSFADSYTNLMAFFRDEANIATTGTTRSAEYDLQGHVFPEIVTTRLLEIAKRDSYPGKTISTRVKIGLITAYVNDIWRIIHDEYGIDDYFKIAKIQPSEIEVGDVRVEWVQCTELLFDLFGSNMIKANPSVPNNQDPDVVVPDVIENLTFPSLSGTSTARSVNFTDDATSAVVWGAGQEQKGNLVYTANNPPTGTDDYTVIDHNKIVLNPTKWKNSIEANILGLLNVDTRQGE